MKKLVPILIVALLAVAGCGSGNDDSGGGADDEAQVRALLKDSSGLLADEKFGEYCELLSPDAISQIEESEALGANDCESLMEVAAGFVSESDLQTLAEPESVEIDGDTAFIEFGSGAQGTATAQKVDGEWKLGPNAEEDSGDSGSS